jgi:hypothetical protein
MGNAYKCDISGKLCEGEGIKNLNVDITPGVRLTIVPHNKISEKQFGQGTISPEGAARIQKALQAEFAPAANSKT